MSFLEWFILSEIDLGTHSALLIKGFSSFEGCPAVGVSLYLLHELKKIKAFSLFLQIKFMMFEFRSVPDEYETENMNPEDIYNSIKKTSADIQKWSNQDAMEDMKKGERDSTSQVHGVFNNNDNNNEFNLYCFSSVPETEVLNILTQMSLFFSTD